MIKKAIKKIKDSFAESKRLNDEAEMEYRKQVGNYAANDYHAEQILKIRNKLKKKSKIEKYL